MWSAVERVAKAAAASKVDWAILPPNVAAAHRCVEMGCRMLSIGLDVLAVLRGWRSYKEEYADFFASNLT
jgi:2-keto-3-deoxy-L-rhamnonate aldolase RhmA